MSNTRGNWNSKLGFILAASGSAIGLGNIVFFSSNAYQYGGGAFYIPYFLALFVLGMPIMMLEFGMGTMTGRSFPVALRKLAGKKAEFAGWWSVSSAVFITMYYVAILGWAFGMMLASLGSLFTDDPLTDAFGIASGAPRSMAYFFKMRMLKNQITSTKRSGAPRSMAYFFDMIATWWPLLFVLVIWFFNILILRKGAESIEKAVRIFVPLMWLFMLGLVIRGLTLDGGFEGVMYLFTPDFEGISDPGVWKGAFSQMFFSLSLGMGTMTAYASYLPKDSDQVNNSMLVSFLNCSFEYIAGIAIFALLFVFALNPAGGTLTISFFVIPEGINQLSELPWLVRLFGFFFFLLIVMAGITSSVSLIESPASALIDKLKISRKKALALVAVPGIIGSLLCTLPIIIDSGLTGNGTLGLTILDITDHWVFNYSLLTVGLIEAIMIGWVMGADKLRAALNKHAKMKLGVWFEWLLKWIIPILLFVVIVLSLFDELPLYGSTWNMPGFSWLSIFIPVFWLISSLGIAYYLSNQPTEED